MTQDGNISDRAYELLRFKCETLKDGVAQASKATAASLTTLIILFCVFALVTYGDFVDQDVPVPFLMLRLNRWHAAALGPPLLSIAAFNFACTRALLQMRVKLLIPHLKALFEDPAGADGQREITPEQLVGATLHPSTHVVFDYLYVRNWRGFRIVIGLMVFLWSLAPIALIQIAYTVLDHYGWNPFLGLMYLICITIGLYSITRLLKAQEAEVYFDFND
jgi:hypothetical protein